MGHYLTCGALTWYKNKDIETQRVYQMGFDALLGLADVALDLYVMIVLLEDSNWESFAVMVNSAHMFLRMFDIISVFQSGSIHLM